MRFLFYRKSSIKDARIIHQNTSITIKVFRLRKRKVTIITAIQFSFVLKQAFYYLQLHNQFIHPTTNESSIKVAGCTSLQALINTALGERAKLIPGPLSGRVI